MISRHVEAYVLPRDRQRLSRDRYTDRCENCTDRTDREKRSYYLTPLFTVCTVCTIFTTVCGTVCRRSLTVSAKHATLLYFFAFPYSRSCGGEVLPRNNFVSIESRALFNEPKKIQNKSSSGFPASHARASMLQSMMKPLPSTWGGLYILISSARHLWKQSRSAHSYLRFGEASTK